MDGGFRLPSPEAPDGIAFTHAYGADDDCDDDGQLHAESSHVQHSSNETLNAPLPGLVLGTPAVSPLIVGAAEQVLPDVARLAARVTSSSPGLGGATAALSQLRISPLHHSTSVVGSASVPLTRPNYPAATDGLRRHRHRGRAVFTGNVASLRSNPAFWDAALRAALAASAAATGAPGNVTTASSLPAASTEQPSARSPTNSASDSASERAAASTGDPAVDMVVSALASVGEALASLLPHRPDRARALAERFDPSTLGPMLLRRALSHADWLDLLRYTVAVVGSLEAPARSASTVEWAASAEQYVRDAAAALADAKARAGIARKETAAAAATAAANTTCTSGTPITGFAPGHMRIARQQQTPDVIDDVVLHMLPRLLAWVHWKVSVIRIDISNLQLAEVGAYLASRNSGVEYERTRFYAAIERNGLHLDGTRHWLLAAAATHITAPDAGGSPGTALLRVLRDGVLRLVELPFPLTEVARAAAANADGIAVQPRGGDNGGGNNSDVTAIRIAFPETYTLDIRRLTDAQNVIQRTALVGALCAIVAGLVASAPLDTALGAAVGNREPVAQRLSAGRGPAVATVAELGYRARTWLLDDSVVMDDIVAGCIAAADDLCVGAGRQPLLSFPNATGAIVTKGDGDADLRSVAAKRMRTTLGAAVRKAASTDHPLYVSFLRRALAAIGSRITAAFTSLLSRGGEAEPRAAVVAAPQAVSDLPAACIADVDALGIALARVIVHNERVHGAMYRSVMGQSHQSATQAGTIVVTVAPVVAHSSTNI